MRKKANSVDAYIKAAPKEVQGRLRELRAIIRTAAPKAEERISYGMPYYGYRGRLAKTHVGFYIPPPVIAYHRKELKGYGTSTATIRFPQDKRLPATLIRKLIKARIKKNETGKR